MIAGLPRYDLTKPNSLGPAGGRQPSSGGNQSLTEAGRLDDQHECVGAVLAVRIGRQLPRPSRVGAIPASGPACTPVTKRPCRIVPAWSSATPGCWAVGFKARLGPMFCINGNMGNMYLFTADGLFVSTLFHDIRLRPNWAAPVADRNMDVTDVSLHDENFWPSITQTADGQVFLVDGGRTSLVRVDGLETLTRLPEQTITVTADDLQRARRLVRPNRNAAPAATRQRHPERAAASRRRHRSMASSTTGRRRPTGPSSIAAAPRPTSTATRALRSQRRRRVDRHASLCRLAHHREGPAQQQRRNAQRAVQTRRLPRPDAGHRPRCRTRSQRRPCPAISGC